MVDVGGSSSLEIPKPQRLPRPAATAGDVSNLSEPELEAWWIELMNYLHQIKDFVLFKTTGAYATWQPALSSEPEERIQAVATADQAGDLMKRRHQLNNILVIIAQLCSPDLYQLIFRQANLN